MCHDSKVEILLPVKMKNRRNCDINLGVEGWGNKCRMLDIEPTKEKLHAALTFELVKNERRNAQLSQGHGIF